MNEKYYFIFVSTMGLVLILSLLLYLRQKDKVKKEGKELTGTIIKLFINKRSIDGVEFKTYHARLWYKSKATYPNEYKLKVVELNKGFYESLSFGHLIKDGEIVGGPKLIESENKTYFTDLYGNDVHYEIKDDEVINLKLTQSKI